MRREARDDIATGGFAELLVKLGLPALPPCFSLAQYPFLVGENSLLVGNNGV